MGQNWTPIEGQFSTPIDNLVAVKQIITVADILRALGYDPGRRTRMRCPIHGGDNPSSFMLTTTTFVCFSCGARGDVVALVRVLKNVEFQDALAYCARLAGIDPRRPRRARVRRAMCDRERAGAAVAQDRAARQTAWRVALDGYFEASAECRFLEGLWRRDRDALSPLTARVLELLSESYVRREALERCVDGAWQQLAQMGRTA